MIINSMISSSGGGGTGLVFPTYTLTENSGSYTATCDMTFAQILQAIEGGTCAYAVINTGSGQLTTADVTMYSSSTVVFAKYAISSQIDVIVITHPSTGSIDVNVHVIPIDLSLYVEKDGDTMTGALKVSNAEITKDVAPSSTQYTSNFIVSDSNDVQIGYIGAYQSTSDDEGLNIGVARTVGGSAKYNSILMSIDSAGGNHMYFSDPAVWRNGLGVPATSAVALLASDNTFDGNATYKNSGIDRDGSNPSAVVYGDNIVFSDKNGERIGHLRVNQYTSGVMQIQMSVFSEDTSNSEIYNYLRLNIAKDGTRAVEVADAGAWRSTLDVPQLGASTNKYAGSQILEMASVDTTKANNDLSSSNYRIFGSKDKNDTYITFMQTCAYTDGATAVELAARNYGTGSNVTNLLRLKVANDGTRSVEFSEVGVWRTALDIANITNSAGGGDVYIANKSGTYRIALTSAGNLRLDTSSNAGASWTTGAGYFFHSGTSHAANTVLAAPNGSAGGASFRALVAADVSDLNTWTTVTLANFATASSGWAFSTSNCNVQYNAALGALRVRIQIYPSANQTAGQKTIFTVKTAYRPKTFAASLSSLTSYAQAGQIYTNGGFATNITAISANTNLYFNGVYFIGA